MMIERRGKNCKIPHFNPEQLWRIRFACEFHRRTGWPWRSCCEAAEAMLEHLNNDTTEMEPIEAVDEELSNWTD